MTGSYEQDLADFGNQVRRVSAIPGPRREGRIVSTDLANGTALVNFADESAVTVKLLLGTGHAVAPGETYACFQRRGPVDAEWVATERISVPTTSFGESLTALLPTLVLPIPAYGGILTESETAIISGGILQPGSTNDPGGVTRAAIYVYFRSVDLGFYNVYSASKGGPFRNVRVQLRELGDTEWVTSDVAFAPTSLFQLTTTASMATGATSVAVSIPSLISPDMLVDQAASWHIGTETILAVLGSGAVAGFPANTLTVVGPSTGSQPELGLSEFAQGAGGRGQDLTVATSHPSGSLVMLQSASVILKGLRPGVSYQLRLALVNSYNRNGPFSAVVDFVSWKQLAVPAAPSNLVVEQRAAGIWAHWDRVVTDVAGNYRSDVHRYAVLRAPVLVTLTGLTLAAATAAVIAAGGTVVDENVGSTSATSLGAQYGNYIAVAAKDDSLNLGAWSWAQDDLAPPYPDPAGVSFMSVPNGILATVAASGSFNSKTGASIAARAENDPGFAEFWLWKADDSSGASAAVVGRSRSTQIPYQTDRGSTGWYKVTAADGAWNSNGPATYPASTPKSGLTNPNTANWTTGWKFCASLYAENSWPINGNFQDPNETNDDARWWVRTPVYDNPAYLTSLLYLGNIGVEGNRAYRGVIANTGVVGFTMARVRSEPQVLPAQKAPTVTFWAKASVTQPYGGQVDLDIYAQDFARVGFDAPVGTMNGAVGATLTAGVWTKFTITLTVVRLTAATAVSGTLFVAVYAALGSTPFTVDIDSVEVTWS